MKLTAKEVYDKLINDDKVLTQQGRITFKFSNVDIIVKQRDVVGNIMQEWLEGWLRHNGIEYAPNDNTQMPPDVFLDPEDKKHNLMEVKAFNYAANPGFDIADFRMYERERRGNGQEPLAKESLGNLPTNAFWLGQEQGGMAIEPTN